MAKEIFVKVLGIKHCQPLHLLALSQLLDKAPDPTVHGLHTVQRVSQAFPMCCSNC